MVRTERRPQRSELEDLIQHPLVQLAAAFKQIQTVEVSPRFLQTTAVVLYVYQFN